MFRDLDAKERISSIFKFCFDVYTFDFRGCQEPVFLTCDGGEQKRHLLMRITLHPQGPACICPLWLLRAQEKKHLHSVWMRRTMKKRWRKIMRTD